MTQKQTVQTEQPLIPEPDEMRGDPWNYGMEQVNEHDRLVWQYVTQKAGGAALEGSSNNEGGISEDDLVGWLAEDFEIPRDKFQRMVPDAYASRAVDSYVDSYAPEFLKHQKPPGVVWLDWLANRASDPQLLNFLQWQYAMLEQQEKSPRVQTRIHEIEEQVEQRVEQGKQEGWISQSASFFPPDVMIGDVFRTTSRGSAGHYGEQGWEGIVITQGVGKTEQEREDSIIKHIENTLPHELMHGAISIKCQGELDTYSKEEPIAARWINEALTEHIALVIEKGWPSVVRPITREKRFGRGGIYAAERQLLNTLLTAGKHKVSPELATRAYSGTQEERDEFYEALDTAWGTEHMLQKVSAYIDTRERESKVRKFSKEQGEILLRMQRKLLQAAGRAVF